MNSWLLGMGMETLPLRMQKHCDNAMQVAEFLKNHPKVSWVRYAGLAGDKYYELGKKYLPLGCCGVVSFGVKGGPTLVVTDGEQVATYYGVPEIKKYLAAL